MEISSFTFNMIYFAFFALAAGSIRGFQSSLLRPKFRMSIPLFTPQSLGFQLFPLRFPRKVHFAEDSHLKEFDAEAEPRSVEKLGELYIKTKLESDHRTLYSKTVKNSEIFPVWLFGPLGAKALAERELPLNIASAGVRAAIDDFGMMILSSRNSAVISMYQVGPVGAYQRFIDRHYA